MPPTMTANQKKTSLTSMEAKLRPVRPVHPQQRKRPEPDLPGGRGVLQEYGAAADAQIGLGWQAGLAVIRVAPIADSSLGE
jgi:hypothetical protein